MAGRDFKSCVARSARFFSQRKLGWRYKASSRASLAPLASVLEGSWDGGEDFESAVARCARFFLEGSLLSSERCVRAAACGCVRLRALCVLFALFSLQGHAHVSSRRLIVPADLSERGMLTALAHVSSRRLGVSADLSERGMLSRMALPRRHIVPADLSERGMLTALLSLLGVSLYRRISRQ